MFRVGTPAKYQPSYSFSGFQEANPSRPLPAQRVDVEFQNVARTTSELIAALGDVRRSDGQLANGIVTLEALSTDVQGRLGGGGGGGPSGPIAIGDVTGLRTALSDLEEDVGLLGTGKANRSTTLAGYGIQNAYNKTEINKLLADIQAGAGGGGDSGAVILGKLQEVDGPGSGLNADLLDGFDASHFATLGTDGKVPASQLPAVQPTAKWAGTVLSPYQFGGVGDGVADDTAALNACFEEVRRLALASRGSANGWNTQVAVRVDLTGGKWRITGDGINATNLESWSLEITGGLLIGECPGVAILDLVNSRGFTLRQVAFYGSRTAMPSAAYQLARGNGGAGFCDNCSFYEVSTTGWFSVAAVFVYAHETALHSHCTYFNYNHQAHVAIFQGFDHVKMASRFTAVTTGDTSFINNKVDICDFRYLPIGDNYRGVSAITAGANPTVTTSAPHAFANGDRITFPGGNLMQTVFTVANATSTTFTAQGATSGSADAAAETAGGVVRAATKSPVVLARASDFNFDTSYIVSYGQPHLLIRFDQQFHKIMEKIRLDLLFEGSGQDHNVAVVTGGAQCAIQGFELVTYASHAKLSVVGLDAQQLNLYDAKVASYRQNSGAKLLSPEPGFAVYGADFTANQHAQMNPDNFVAFTGQCLSIATGTIVSKGVAVGEERGTWSPRLQGQNGAEISSYSASGSWHKSGSLVFVELSWTISSVGGASGPTLQVSNMPFARTMPTCNLVGRSSRSADAGKILAGNGCVGNPRLLNLAIYDTSSLVVSGGAGYASGTFVA